MAQLCDIEPVAPLRLADAVRFLVAGSQRDMDIAARAERLIQIARSRGPDDMHLWWARAGGAIRASAMALANAGHSGMVLYSPPAAPGVDPAVLPEVIRGVSLAALQGGLSFVQAMVEPSAAVEIQLLEQAGYERLADLIYMRLPARSAQAPQNLDRYQWRSYSQVTGEYLGKVISQTYKNSLDCPKLSGLRSMADVIASHQASGVFRPESWWTLEQDGQPAGCILVNDYAEADAADVVYLGVTPEFRGRGLARLMLRRAAIEARVRGLSAVTLAVDAANIYAMRVYQSEGFIETDRRLAYALIGR